MDGAFRQHPYTFAVQNVAAEVNDSHRRQDSEIDRTGGLGQTNEPITPVEDVEEYSSSRLPALECVRVPATSRPVLTTTHSYNASDVITDTGLATEREHDMPSEMIANAVTTWPFEDVPVTTATHITPTCMSSRAAQLFDLC